MNSKFKSKSILFFRQYIGILIGLLAIIILFSVISPTFLTSMNITNILRTASSNIYLACGMTMVIILGGIDLSVGSVIALSGVVTVSMIAGNVPVAIAVLGGVVIGVISGLFNGFVLAYTTIPAFIVTLASMDICRGAAYVVSNGQPIRCMDDNFINIGCGYLGSIPLPVIYFIVIALFSSILLNKTKFGRYVYATGGNREAAQYSGVKIKKVTVITYLLSGIFAAIAGVVLASRMFSGQPTSGNGAEMDAVAAVVLGGTSMTGGSGKIGGTIIGALVIGTLNNGLNLMNVNSFWQYIVKGIVILLAVYIDFLKQKRQNLSKIKIA